MREAAWAPTISSQPTIEVASVAACGRNGDRLSDFWDNRRGAIVFNDKSLRAITSYALERPFIEILLFWLDAREHHCSAAY
jgi:hypothetical protein